MEGERWQHRQMQLTRCGGGVGALAPHPSDAAINVGSLRRLKAFFNFPLSSFNCGRL